MKIIDFNKYLDGFSLNFPHRKKPLILGLHFYLVLCSKFNQNSFLLTTSSYMLK
nr:MAG TPA: hypothetical protein [Caudoviricetes sp.]